MFNTKEKRYLILKVISILFCSLIVISIVRIMFFSSALTSTLFFKELIFSLFCTLFVVALVYMFIKKDIYKFNSKAQEYAFMDALTGLYNRHYLNEFLENFTSLRKDDSNFAVLFVDIDKFKDVNDTLGHHAGDCILRILALKLKSLTRPKDTLCRYGGEEFVIVLSGISNEDALQKAEIMRTSVQDMLFDCEQQKITISLGLSFGNNDDDINQIIEESDKALYMAKDSGRNCVRVFSSQ